jgi:hypothetical protein
MRMSLVRIESAGSPVMGTRTMDKEICAERDACSELSGRTGRAPSDRRYRLACMVPIIGQSGRLKDTHPSVLRKDLSIDGLAGAARATRRRTHS